MYSKRKVSAFDLQAKFAELRQKLDRDRELKKLNDNINAIDPSLRARIP